MNNETKKLISVKEFAEEYNIGINTAYEFTHISDFPVIKIGRKNLIIKEKVDDFFINNIGKIF